VFITRTHIFLNWYGVIHKGSFQILEISLVC
jgi:hypothetical protein